mmetsp:Transcript_12178/g.21697  ORF Transcript_12178/g.21697 Transcript_12178/m.21697 type:complete len:523 (+) Transcript_12178:52-1620(+)|eukprot:CAMPEP_0201892650 /NCGR_PEP_ID=MMETSP0902-20130614/36925_1 /ASSEMBLY_ACC=CAM_ASM_000551 /TAXON_ID=420261 /ORGANISM="Thalassiosira antarctica, Strain CCMP982" /LENGTH=522 /DNA_ID=CAMNT_0048424171 /DNA_START=32 /DNA_END=1600 /DNA_ORIENTATION=-
MTLASNITRYNRAAAVVTAAVIILQTRESSCFSPTAKGYHIGCNFAQRKPTNLRSNGVIDIDVVDADDEPCLLGDNIVASCDVTSGDSIMNEVQTMPPPRRGTQTKLSAATNLGKCICGAGSFALPHVFLKEGVLGGTLAITICAFLAMNTMQSINRSRFLAVANEPLISPPTSYVELTKLALGDGASKVVFSLTLAASLGVCSTYIVFVGQTLASLSADAMSANIVHTLAPNIDETTWEIITAATVLPISLVRNYGVFAFTSALGVTAVLGGILVTLAYGVLVDPGGGIGEALSAVSQLKMWPDSFSDAFGGSFGTIAYLFCINFLTFPIINSMKDSRNDYDGAVSSAVAVIWMVNALFAIVCLGFYGEETQDLVLQNLDNGPYLSALKILLCVDLLFTFPVVFSSGRQILENVLLDESGKEEEEETMSLALSRATITSGAVATCFGLSQVGGFGVVANLVGGVAQGTLAFIIPPAIAVALSRRSSNGNFEASEISQWLIGGFGVAVVSSVTYFTLAESLG